MNDKAESGKRGERESIAYLKDMGFTIENTGTEKANSPYDILARKDDLLYAINTKSVSTKKGVFGIQLSNISRLLGFCETKNAIPAYIFVHNYKFTFFTFKGEFSEWGHPIYTGGLEEGYVRLTVNIANDDIKFIDGLIEAGMFASRTDAAREAFRCLRRDVEGTKKTGVKQVIKTLSSCSSATGAQS